MTKPNKLVKWQSHRNSTATPANARAFRRLSRQSKAARARNGGTPVGQMPSFETPGQAVPGIDPGAGS